MKIRITITAVLISNVGTTKNYSETIEGNSTSMSTFSVESITAFSNSISALFPQDKVLSLSTSSDVIEVNELFPEPSED